MLKLKKRKQKLSPRARKKISKSLRAYWRTWEGRRRKHEYLKILPGQEKAYRKAQETFHGKKGEYDTHLYERQKPKGGYKRIALEDFKKGRTYLVYIVHRKTKRSRLLYSGPQWEFPVASKKWTEEHFKPVITQSRRFNPLKLKRRGKWLPITRFYNRALKNIESQAAMMKENYKIRGSIMPLKRYYNPELMIFSDEPIKRNRIVKQAFAHVVTSYDYPNTRWISARHVKIDFTKGIRVKDLANELEQLEGLAEEALRLEHRKADIHVLMIDGFIPTQFYTEKEFKKNKKRRLIQRKKREKWEGRF